VGADTCGFDRNTDEELCNRWMQLSAFVPFYRNHNVLGALPQEPYRWDSVAEASRKAMATRYSLLPYWYTLFANASRFGTPPVRALFFEFPDETELFAVDTQFLIGGDILVTPVLEPNTTTVKGIFPGTGKVTWRDWYTHDVVQQSASSVELSAPLGHINVHVRDGAAILLYANPAYTTFETSQGPFSLLVSQARDGSAFGSSYIDDGDSDPPGPSREVTIKASRNEVRIMGQGSFHVIQHLDEVMVLGVPSRPRSVYINGRDVYTWNYLEKQGKLVASGLAADLNSDVLLQWK
jgi:alpha-glucosidase